MQQLRDAIIHGARGRKAGAPHPDHYRAFVRREDTGMFEGIESADKIPQEPHIGEVPTSRWRRTRSRRRDGQLDQLQHGLTSICRYRRSAPRPPGRRVGRPPRPRLPGRRVRRLGVVLRRARAVVEARRPSRSTATTWTTRPQQPRRLDVGQPAHLGSETNFGGLAELAVVKANQLMPPAHHSGVAAVNAVQLHQLPDAGRRARRPHEAGRQRPGWGTVVSAATPPVRSTAAGPSGCRRPSGPFRTTWGWRP